MTLPHAINRRTALLQMGALAGAFAGTTALAETVRIDGSAIGQTAAAAAPTPTPPTGPFTLPALPTARRSFLRMGYVTRGGWRRTGLGWPIRRSAVAARWLRCRLPTALKAR